MIEFINEKTGNLYRTYPVTGTDKKEPYTFCFEDKQSTGYYYQKRLYFISDNSSYNVRIASDNGTFFIYDLSKPQPYKLNNSSTGVIQYNVTYTGTETQSVEGENTIYLYCINLGCYNEAPGDYSCEFFIGNYKYCISATFWGQQENLEILLQNQGVTIPYDFTRAIYDTNVHTQESTPDWVVVNKKFKELLINSVDILYKKGSYDSLIKSFGWFEWENAHIYEYWTNKSKIIRDQIININFDELIRDLMNVYYKTTFISINVPIKELKTTDGYVKYETISSGERTVPILKDILFKWSKNDIALKLTLLGNYFSTFFMPLHLDLLFSSIEDLVMNALLGKTLFTNIYRTDREDISTEGDVIFCNNIQENYYLEDYNCRGKGVVLSFNNMSLPKDSDKQNVEPDTYLGKGVLIELDLEVKNIGGTITGSYNKLMVGTTEVPVIVENGKVKLNYADTKAGDKIYVFIKDPGKHIIGINLFNDCGTPIMCTYNINVNRYISEGIDIYRLIRMSNDEINTHKKQFDENTFSLAFPNTPEGSYDIIYNYPESMKNYVSCCKFETGKNVYLFVNNNQTSTKTFDNIDAAKDFFKDMNNFMFISKYVNSTLSYGYIIKLYEDGSNNTYAMQLNSSRGKDSSCDSGGKVNWFYDKRFLPFLYKKELVNGIPQIYKNFNDFLYEYVPTCKYDEGVNNVWEIMNERTRKTCIIKNRISPIVWCDNNIRQNDKNGVYSITLKLYPGTANEKIYKRKCFAKLDVPSNINTQ